MVFEGVLGGDFSISSDTPAFSLYQIYSQFHLSLTQRIYSGVLVHAYIALCLVYLILLLNFHYGSWNIGRNGQFQ